MTDEMIDHRAEARVVGHHHDLVVQDGTPAKGENLTGRQAAEEQVVTIVVDGIEEFEVEPGKDYVVKRLDRADAVIETKRFPGPSTVVTLRRAAHERVEVDQVERPALVRSIRSLGLAWPLASHVGIPPNYAVINRGTPGTLLAGRSQVVCRRGPRISQPTDEDLAFLCPQPEIVARKSASNRRLTAARRDTLKYRPLSEDRPPREQQRPALGSAATGEVGRTFYCVSVRWGDPMAADNQASDVDAFVARLRADVLDSADRLADVLADNLVASANARRDFPSGEPAEMRSSFVRAVGLFVRNLWGHGNLEDGEAWKAMGAHRAHRGEDEDTVVGDLDDAAGAVWQSILDRAKTVDSPGPVAIAATAGLWKQFEDVVMQARFDVRSGYRAASGDLAISDRPQAAFIDRLVSGAFSSDGDIRDTAGRIGYSMAVPQLLFVVFRTSENTGVYLDAGVRAVADALGAIGGSVRSDPREHSAVLVPCPSTEAFESAVRRTDKVASDHDLVVIGIGPIDQPIRFAAEYRGLLRDATVVDMTTSVPGAVNWSDFNHHRLISRAPVEERFGFVMMVLGRLLSHKRAETLLATLNALFETGEGQEGAARRLGVHSRTVRGRLGTISGLLDESLDHPREMLRVFTATRLARTLKTELSQARPTPAELGGQRAWR